MRPETPTTKTPYRPERRAFRKGILWTGISLAAAMIVGLFLIRAGANKGVTIILVASAQVVLTHVGLVVALFSKSQRAAVKGVLAAFGFALPLWFYVVYLFLL